MFKNEYEYLVHLIKCALYNEQPLEIPQKLSFDKVFSYGREHEVANIAFVVLERLNQKPTEELYEKWEMVYALSVRRHANQMAARNTIIKALAQNNIRYIEAQGTVLKKLYPHPEWRMMSDIDFIIDKENIDKAFNLLKGLDFSPKKMGDYEIDAIGKNKVYAELHSNFFDPGAIGEGSILNPFSHAEANENSLCFRLNNTYLYLYNLLHCVKHFSKSGAGIRRIIDLHLLTTKLSDSIDKNFVNEVLEKSGLKDTAEALLSVAEQWFSCTNTQKDISKTEELVFKSNNHGSTEVRFKNQYKKADILGKLFFKANKYAELLFPKKENVYIAYPFCRKHKYPIVLCWLHRWTMAFITPAKRRNAFGLLSEIKKTKIK